jgi:hypothetical protein
MAAFTMLIPGCSPQNDSLPELGTAEDYLARRENSAYIYRYASTTCAQHMIRIVSRPTGIWRPSTISRAVTETTTGMTASAAAFERAVSTNRRPVRERA